MLVQLMVITLPWGVATYFLRKEKDPRLAMTGGWADAKQGWKVFENAAD